MSAGYVYVLENKLMPGVVKIGYSKYGGDYRAADFYRNDTAVAVPFTTEFEIHCSDAQEIEKRVHRDLSIYRINKKREFFKCDVRDAVESIVEHVADDIEIPTRKHPRLVELDFEDGGIFHELMASHEYSAAKVTEAEYAQAVVALSMDAKLVFSKVMKRREAEKNKTGLRFKSYSKATH